MAEFNKNPKVAIVIGSVSDRETMAECKRYLEYFGIEYEERILSAHRTPEETSQFAKDAENLGFNLLIAAAGMAAHLPGVLAAHTTLPVIGVPLANSDLRGLDALYSIVQMPAGVPVATVAIGQAGAVNAAVLAAEILASQYRDVKQKLVQFKKQGSRIE